MVLFDGAVGNADYLDTELSGALGYRGETHWVRVYPAYRVKRSNRDRVVDTRSVHLRHSLFLTARSRTFAFVQLQSEQAIQLEKRFLLGGGYATNSSRSGLVASMWVWVSCSRKNNEQARP